MSSQASQLIKVAPDSANVAHFICQASGAPEVDFSWFKNDTLLNKTVNHDIRHQAVSNILKIVLKIKYGSWFKN